MFSLKTFLCLISYFFIQYCSSSVTLVLQEPFVSTPFLTAFKLHDISGDGLLDIIYSTSLGQIFWIENQGNGSWFNRQVLPSEDTRYFLSQISMAQMDGDDTEIDFVVPIEYGKGAMWVENNYIESGTFIQHNIIRPSEANTFDPSIVHGVSLDGDTLVDVVISSKLAKTLCWFKNPDSEENWLKFNVTDTEMFVETIDSTDIDRDGDFDIIVGADSGLYFFENRLNEDLGFTEYSVSGTITDTAHFVLDDIDGDGDLDVIALSLNSLLWFKNDLASGLGPGSHSTVAWESHVIGSTSLGLSVSSADLDGDLDSDILVVSQGQIAWYENTGSGISWIKRTLNSENYVDPLGVISDFDGDGLFDIVLSRRLAIWAYKGITSYCGNTIINFPEECDDGNLDTTDDCVSCKNAFCGDSFLKSTEECDDGGLEIENCVYGEMNCTTCLSCIIQPGLTYYCGDNKIDPIPGGGVEECDDGNLIDGDGCSGCIRDICGDGITNNGEEEECDDGNLDDEDNCTNVCKFAVCGDGIRSSRNGEECDDGNLNTTDSCTTECTLAICGDGFVQEGEECDDGNTVQTDSCTNSCEDATCGDTIVQIGVEECDDGNRRNRDSCTNACKNATCGDRFLQPGEECDDGNTVQTDRCTNACKFAVCGDGIRSIGNGEECDDGNLNETDSCTNSCKDATCGDGFIQEGVEECDDRNLNSNDGCSELCIIEFCGDNIRNNIDEECDDGNDNNTDLCSNSCVLANCGDGTLQEGEECDDGNNVNNDGCTGCSKDICGDGIRNTPEGTLDIEACDDGNTVSNDGCSEVCVIESCGDSFLNNLEVEECDDGNTDSNDGCSSDCKTEICGDGIINMPSSFTAIEACDNGVENTLHCEYSVQNCSVCTPNCTIASGNTSFCGDSNIDSEFEGCDDGNSITEECSYGVTSCRVCDSSCQDTRGETSFCGDSTIDSLNGEDCDDGNAITEECSYGDRNCTICDFRCKSFEDSRFCGNSIISDAEQCDDGNTITETCPYGELSCQICDSFCKNVSGATSFCGDSNLDSSSEDCDDGNTLVESCAYGETSCIICDGSCKNVSGATSYCGDSNLDSSSEDCDDGNSITEPCAYGEPACTVCNDVCRIVPGVVNFCGDGEINVLNSEQCDNGENNTDSFECSYGETDCVYCDPTCNTAIGVTSFCGDSVVDSSNGELCDIALENKTACEYGETSCTICSSTCIVIAGGTSYCGDLNVDTENGEECDESDGLSGGCLNCKKIPVQLSSLSIVPGILIPEFNSTILDYSLALSGAITSVVVTAETLDLDNGNTYVVNIDGTIIDGSTTVDIEFKEDIVLGIETSTTKRGALRQIVAYTVTLQRESFCGDSTLNPERGEECDAVSDDCVDCLIIEPYFSTFIVSNSTNTLPALSNEITEHTTSLSGAISTITIDYDISIVNDRVSPSLFYAAFNGDRITSGETEITITGLSKISIQIISENFGTVIKTYSFEFDFLPYCGDRSTNTDNEECDGEACCSSDCKFLPSETICRNKTNLCDTIMCSGSSAFCPLDEDSNCSPEALVASDDDNSSILVPILLILLFILLGGVAAAFVYFYFFAGQICQVKILFLGLDNAGKTNINVFVQQGVNVSDLKSSTGFTTHEKRLRKTDFSFFDVAGSEKVRSLWKHYFSLVDAIVWVVDSSDGDRFKESRNELEKVLKNSDVPKNLPILVFANKADSNSATDEVGITEALKLEKLMGALRKWHIISTDARSGQGIIAGLDWLNEVLVAKNKDEAKNDTEMQNIK